MFQDVNYTESEKNKTKLFKIEKKRPRKQNGSVQFTHLSAAGHKGTELVSMLE